MTNTEMTVTEKGTLEDEVVNVQEKTYRLSLSLWT